MKKVLSLALCLVLALSMFAIVPMTASAAEAELSPTAATSGKTGECTWSLDGTVLTISGNGSMGHYAISGRSPWGTSITRLVIKNGVTDIGNFGFYGCNKLSSVVIPGSVTKIGMHAFAGCESMKSFTIPDTVTDILPNAFSGCSGLENLTIGSSVTSDLYGVFDGCSSLKSITVSANNKFFDSRDNCNAIIETKTNSLLLGCKNTVIPNSVTQIYGEAFSGSSGITSITIPDSVTSIGYGAFSGCENLENITVPDSVTNIGCDAFYDTPWYYNQPDGLVYAGKVAYKYKGSCPACVEIKEGTVGIADFAFSDCSDLEDVTIPDTVTSIGSNVFYDTLWYDNQPDGLVYAGKVVLGFKNYWDNYYESAEIDEGTLGIADSAFSYCSDLEEVIIPDSVVRIGDYAFDNCENLASVTIPASVTSIGDSAFGYTIDDNTGLTVKVNGFSICGYNGTAAEQYANDNGFTFISLGDKPSGMILGDADNDGEVTILDATVIQRTIAELPTVSYNEAAADADQDNSVTIMDATSIQRHIAELPTNENIGKPI